jgi:hypothetical protein
MKYQTKPQEIMPGYATKDDLFPKNTFGRAIMEYIGIWAITTAALATTVYASLGIFNFFEACREANSSQHTPKVKAAEITPVKSLDDIKAE